MLTAVVGGYLTRHYTIQQTNLTEAAKIFNDHSKLLGDRYFAQNRLHSFLAQLMKRSCRKTKLNWIRACGVSGSSQGLELRERL
jgi:hypothetical protein